ncbi:hypothetical protein PTNB73_00427 [Pyrenophora teres f. teres]|nr:hypothetical protein HRS9139_01669 [Pyrenophora teres f. teres]KAE8851410.1 hypothetical protein HRS9122_01697 [Pyrenophora teres f. teres]KAE8873795.1 hypothetical protein PTNB73_00427 [Pyrenophora teres f. teres]
MDIDAEMAQFRSMKKKEMQEAMKRKNKAVVAFKDKMRTSGNVDALCVEYRKYLGRLALGAQDEGESSRKTASPRTRHKLSAADEGGDEADEEGVNQTRTNVLEQVFSLPERSISTATRTCLQILQTPDMDKHLIKAAENDMSQYLGPALVFVKDWGRAYSQVSDSLVHNYATNMEKMRLLVAKSVPNIKAAPVYVPFFEAMGVGVDQTVILSEDVSNAVRAELDVIWTAINYTLEIWKSRFPVPPPDQLAWPSDFSSRDKTIVRKFIKGFLDDKPHLLNKTATRDEMKTAVSKLKEVWPISTGKTIEVARLSLLDTISSRISWTARSASRSSRASTTSEAPSSHPSLAGEEDVQVEDNGQVDAADDAGVSRTTPTPKSRNSAGKRRRHIIDISSDESDDVAQQDAHSAKKRRTASGRGRGRQERGTSRLGHAATASGRSRRASPTKIGALSNLKAVEEERDDEGEEQEQEQEEMLM